MSPTRSIGMRRIGCVNGEGDTADAKAFCTEGLPSFSGSRELPSGLRRLIIVPKTEHTNSGMRRENDEQFRSKNIDDASVGGEVRNI